MRSTPRATWGTSANNIGRGSPEGGEEDVQDSRTLTSQPLQWLQEKERVHGPSGPGHTPSRVNNTTATATSSAAATSTTATASPSAEPTQGHLA